MPAIDSARTDTSPRMEQRTGPRFADAGAPSVDRDRVGVVGHAPADPSLERARRAMTVLFGAPAARSFAVRYWDAAAEPAGSASGPPFTLIIRDRGALRRMFLPPTELTLAEAFVRGDFDVEGDLETATGLAPALAERLASARAIARLVALLARLPRADSARDVPQAADGRRRFRPTLTLRGHRHARQRDAAAVRHHYDVGNDFYALWLDEARVYSCAYFVTGTESLDVAQRAKLDLICRKLRLQPGETLLDIGCGWGGLVRHAARHYGVDVLGVTLSEAQAALARQRIVADGLDARCRVEVRDYRDLLAGSTFDKVVSVGMFEHVGRAQLASYFRTAFRLVRPGGLFLNHGIVRLDGAREGASNPDSGPHVRYRRMHGAGRFIDRYVFPDGELVPLAVATEAAEAAGFETRDVESLRAHYVLTLRHWLRRLESHSHEAIALAGEQVYRIWRLYMAASAFAFTTAQIGVVQMLLAKAGPGGEVDLPWTRGDLFAMPGDASAAGL